MSPSADVLQVYRRQYLIFRNGKGYKDLAGMGRKKRPWQDVDYVLGYFGRTTSRAKKVYLKYKHMESGTSIGKSVSVSNEKRDNLK